MIDLKFMRRALQLAEKGRGHTSPNPVVGALIVAGEKIVGRGYHQRFGAAHAEINALNEAKDAATGATMYVTLEPCSTQGKTPPCVNSILQAGIKHVIVGMIDPNPMVNGRGIEMLRTNGIEVTTNVLEDAARELNPGYIKYITTGLPFVTVKIAQTLDGQIATCTGHSRWITSEATRKEAHRIRFSHDALLVGVGTVVTDDPQLTVRMVPGPIPKRLVLDSELKIPLDSRLLSDDYANQTIIITTRAASAEKVKRIKDKGADVLVVDAEMNGMVDFGQLLPRLGKMGITSVMIEGGSRVYTSVFKTRHVDRIICFIAPKITGQGIPSLGDLGIRNINAAIGIKKIKIKRFDNDIMISGNPIWYE